MYWLLPQKTAWPSGTSVSKGCSCKENPETQKARYLAECAEGQKEWLCHEGLTVSASPLDVCLNDLL